MEYCKSAIGYACKALVKYCVNSCDSIVDDDSYLHSSAGQTEINNCFCNCTNQVNFNRYCYNGETNYRLSVLLTFVLLGSGLCLICGLCRYRIVSYINDKTKALGAKPANNAQNPPPYYNHHMSVEANTPPDSEYPGENPPTYPLSQSQLQPQQIAYAYSNNSIPPPPPPIYSANTNTQYKIIDAAQNTQNTIANHNPSNSYEPNSYA